MPRERPEGNADSPPIDPFADLLFTLIAAILPAIFVLAPLAQSSVTARGAMPEARATVRVDGRTARTIVAGAEGLRVLGADDRRIGLDAIPDDAALREDLGRLRAEGTPLLLVIEPDGLESAFLFEPVLAAFGPADIHEVRATERCAAARDEALRRACAPRQSAAAP